MTIQTLGKRVRYLQRYKDIAQILIRNGFGWFIDEIGLTEALRLPRRERAGEEERRPASLAQRIRRVLEELGPTFVKIGQVASLRQDLLPPDVIEQLTKLQDEVPPIGFTVVRQIIEEELGASMDALFSSLEEQPIGSASIGQVHRGVLHSGQVVAVKVQRPGIREAIEVDLEILADLASLAERHLEWARHYRVTDVVEEFRRTLTGELNYLLEARNAERIQRLMAGDPSVYIPSIFWDYTTQRVLTMEYVEGVKLNDRAGLAAAGLDRKLLASRCVRAVLSQILVHGVFHADPHPGNLAALPDHRILFMDFGMVGRLTPELKQRLASLIVGLMRRDTDLIIRALYRMGVVPPDVDQRRLRRDVDELREKYYDIPLSQIHLGESVRDIFIVAFRHRIQIPADLALVGKTLVTLEGLVEDLDPTFRVLDVAEPFGKYLLRERLDPRTWLRMLVDSAIDVSDALLDFPRQLRDLLREVRHGRVKVHVNVPEAERLLRGIDTASRHIALSLVLLSLSIFLAGMMIASALTKTASTFLNQSMTVTGLALEALLLLVILWSVLRSRR
jgi:ubiquinone biosynthesis protein